MTVDVRLVDPRDEGLVRRHWEVGRAAEDERAVDLYPAWEQQWVTVSQGRSDREIVLLGAFEQDVMWAAARVDLPVHDNRHVADVECWTHPDRRRRGLGRALLGSACDLALDRGRRVVQGEVPVPLAGPSSGLLFAEALGFTRALDDELKAVDLPTTEHTWDALAVGLPARHEGYRIVTWDDRVPPEHVDGYCHLSAAFLAEAPMGQLEVEPERWDEERIREREQHNAAVGRLVCAAGAVAQDGSLVALTELILSTHAPARGFQSGTLVDPGHRGHGLGLAIKIANHRRVRVRFPDCAVVITGNADVNAAMSAINDQLGYRTVERCVEVQREI